MEKIALDTNPNSNLHFELYQSRGDSIFGLVQISHGMAEHKGRYREFINFLNLNGFHVVIHDHRGHGERIFENKTIDDYMRVYVLSRRNETTIFNLFIFIESII